MAPLPKRKHSSRRQGKRVASLKIRKPTIVRCLQCHKARQPHRACRSCGFYGEQVSRPTTHENAR